MGPLNVCVRIALTAGLGAAVSLRAARDEASATTQIPVIGIMAHPATEHVPPNAADGAEYVAASYVKFVEMAGGVAVPLSYAASNARHRRPAFCCGKLSAPRGGI